MHRQDVMVGRQVEHASCMSSYTSQDACLFLHVQCIGSAMPVQAAVEQLELAGPKAHEIVLPIVTVCVL